MADVVRWVDTQEVDEVFDAQTAAEVNERLTACLRAGAPYRYERTQGEGVIELPDDFEAVGQVFADFHQVSDDEVRELLATPT